MEHWIEPVAAGLCPVWAWRRAGFARYIWAVAALPVLCLLVACGSEPGPSDPRPQGDQAPRVTVQPTGDQPPALSDFQARARAILAERLSVPAESLELVSDEAVQWADASLGCPADGMVYAQVITPGHRMTFRHDGDTYEVHTAVEGSSLEPVSCEGGVSY